MSSTSYPRAEGDWQGIFIRNIANALADSGRCELGLWAPDGPRHPAIRYLCDAQDRDWLGDMAASGGIAHLLKNNRGRALVSGLSLLRRLRASYRSHAPETDLFHVNWLQNALPLVGMGKPALISLLGTDFQLLKLPGMTFLVRRMLAGNRCALAPNAEWMVPELENAFGDLAGVTAVPFGIDDRWYDLERQPQSGPAIWLAIFRITAAKIGPLFEWGEPLFGSGERELHLIGPNQEGLDIPDWVHFHGPASPEALARDWFPRAQGLITLSRHSEGRPQVMLEAMAAGLPLIASDIEAHSNFVEHDHTGLLVADSDDLRDALQRLEQHECNTRFSAHCKLFASNNYGTWSDCTQRYMTLYETLLQ
jgi:hypothetical protein